MRERRRLAKRTPVREVEHLLDIGPTVVHVGDELLTVARQAFARPQTRILSVVDDQERLVGVIPVLRIVEGVVARAAPEELMAGVVDLESAGRFGREIGARVCRDLMSPPVALHVDSTVADAFHAMKEHHYSGLPVVDDGRHVIGYIDLLELGLRYLAEFPSQAPGDADATAELPRPAVDPPGGTTR